MAERCKICGAITDGDIICQQRSCQRKLHNREKKREKERGEYFSIKISEGCTRRFYLGHNTEFRRNTHSLAKAFMACSYQNGDFSELVSKFKTYCNTIAEHEAEVLIHLFFSLFINLELQGHKIPEEFHDDLTTRHVMLQKSHYVGK